MAATTTPAFLKTFFQHFLDKPSKDSPRHQLAYDEAIVLVKRFLEYCASHTVEQVQSFTANKIPTPSWVAKEEVIMADVYLDRAASHIIDHLGPSGLKTFGGPNWWQYRAAPMKCEWIEMKKDQRSRLEPAAGRKPVDRIILYIHGGAYYFGSVDEHRYQIQRHARKLGGRAFSANYRLSPQYPAPCGIQDNLAAYLYLLETFKPENIILSGDSAGGGMCLALLLVLRDQKIPLPAGCVLISPWVDLNHSFPSIMGDSSGDYIPPSGFQHKPSIAWPPPTSDDIAEARHLDLSAASDDGSVGTDSDAGMGFTVEETNNAQTHSGKRAKIVGNEAEIMIDGKLVTIKDQIQLYATNEQISHPLVSPVVAGSLGGLCPLFIMGGSAELLRDEIVYVAHKAANPKQYPPMEEYLDRDERQRASLNQYPPTMVHLQMYDDCCHVTPTIAMCRPAKYMYRAIANFSLWALARQGASQQQDIAEMLQSLNLVYTANTGTSDSESEDTDSIKANRATHESLPEVKVSGVEPVYQDNMIRERVSIYGLIRPMEPVSEIEALHLDPTEIGTIKPGPVGKFMRARGAHDRKYRKRKAKLQRQRAREYARAEREGFAIGDFKGDKPPPAALAGRASLAEAEKISKASQGSKSGGLINTLFSIVSGSRDKDKSQQTVKA